MEKGYNMLKSVYPFRIRKIATQAQFDSELFVFYAWNHFFRFRWALLFLRTKIIAFFTTWTKMATTERTVIILQIQHHLGFFPVFFFRLLFVSGQCAYLHLMTIISTCFSSKISTQIKTAAVERSTRFQCHIQPLCILMQLILYMQNYAQREVWSTLKQHSQHARMYSCKVVQMLFCVCAYFCFVLYFDFWKIRAKHTANIPVLMNNNGLTWSQPNVVKQTRTVGI